MRKKKADFSGLFMWDLLAVLVEPILERMKEIRVDAAGKMLALRGKRRAARN